MKSKQDELRDALSYHVDMYPRAISDKALDAVIDAARCAVRCPAFAEELKNMASGHHEDVAMNVGWAENEAAWDDVDSYGPSA